MCELIEEYSRNYMTEQQFDQYCASQDEKTYSRADRFQRCLHEAKRHFSNFNISHVGYQFPIPYTRHLDSQQVVNEFELASCDLLLSHGFSIYRRVILRHDTYCLRIQLMLMSNGIPFSIKQKKKRLLMIRSLHGLNSSRKEGAFKINPKTGHLTYQLQNAMLPNHFQSLLIDPQHMMQIIQSELESAVRQFCYNIYKILYLADVYTIQDLNYFSSLGRRFRKIKYDASQIDSLKTYIDYSTVGFNFTENVDWPEREAPHCLVLENQQAQLSQARQTDIEMVLKYLQSYQIDGSNLKPISNNPKQHLQNFLTNKDLKVLMKNQHYRVTNPLENNSVYSQIKIKNEENLRWEHIGEGGFTNIEKAVVECSFVKRTSKYDEKDRKADEPSIQKALVRKVEKAQKLNKGKIGHEKNILSLLQDQSCIYLCKYYYSTQQNCQNILYMENYVYRSLDIFLDNHETTLTQITLIFLMYWAARALRFLKTQGIHHYDVKPANMLIGKNFTLRISDFGESYNQRVCTPEFRPGFTKRYSPPEVYRKKIQFSPACDVFSFGLVMLEVILEKYPIDMRDSDGEGAKKLINFFAGNSSAKLLVVPERTAQLGCSSILLLLHRLFLKNINSKERQRPLIDWNVLALFQSFVYLDSQY